MQYYSGQVAKPDQTKLDSTKPDTTSVSCTSIPIEHMSASFCSKMRDFGVENFLWVVGPFIDEM